ncbi:MAG: Uma2 family endonuclease [Planctomycetaceae bacterium]
MPELAATPATERPSTVATVAPGQPRYRHTVEEYLSFERGSPSKHEYYAGNIYAMTGASRRHVLIVTNLIRTLGNRLADRPCEIYGTDMRLKVGATGLYTYPDVAVTCGEPRFEDAEIDTLLNPQVVIEVLSKSTRDYDCTEKFDHYRGVESVTDYVLVAQDASHVEHRSRQPGGPWSVSVASSLDGFVSLESIGCELPMADIYRRIQLPA